MDGNISIFSLNEPIERRMFFFGSWRPVEMSALRYASYLSCPKHATSPVDAISIETAQSSLDCSVLTKLPGKTIILGVLDLSTNDVETPEIVAARIRRALPYVSADRIIVAPDCGMKYLPRDVAFAKMKAMTDGARLVR